MAQVGRISGPLLEANLQRNGIDLAFETDLLYFDIASGRIGIGTNAPSNDLQVAQTFRTSDLLVDTQADIANINFQNSTVQPFPGNLFLNSADVITANRVKTDNLLLDDDRISTYTTDANIELRPDGSGKTDFYNNLWIQNNLTVTGDVRLDGDITFGDADTDSVIFEADVTSDIVPDIDLTYNLGTPAKRWQTIESRLLNGKDIDTQIALIGGVDIGIRPGNLYYVSTNGDNGNTGDHPQGPWRTIDYAVTQASTGDTILVFPGEYEETCPIEIPAGVALRGVDIRNVVIKPVQSDNYVDVFLLNGESTVTDITVKDFYYDSINDVGYAFRFASGATVTTRSPYIQNISVITKGSVTSADDPRGFAEGDAGKGALVDGASVLNTSNEASMLFHSVTFITPGVDALTMTNGVRVEWLNSFTYFANRGLYATNGVLGFAGESTRFGAEIRSIGSANVYGNYGAVADGADTLMYLIQHNMGYIGSGKYSDNDASRVIQEREIEKLNSGNIYYQTVNHFGDFRIGDNFFINAETGESSIVIDQADIQGIGRLRVTSTDTGNVTIIDGESISTGNLTFSENLIASVIGDVDINSASGVIELPDSVNIVGDLDISGNLTFDGSLNLLGNQSTDTLTFNVNISQNLNPNTTLVFDLGSPFKTWNNIWLSEAQIGDTHIEDNFITTDISNADLELRANGSGEILVPANNVRIDNNLAVNGFSNLQNLSITGTLERIGDTVQTGNFDISGEFSVDNLYLEDNFITTAVGDLNLAAAGDVNVDANDVELSQDLTVNASTDFQSISITGILTQTGDANITGNLSSDIVTVTGNLTVGSQQQFKQISLDGNVITTTTLNSDLELRASGTGIVLVPDNNVRLDNDISTNDTSNTGDISIANQTEFAIADVSDIDISGNLITTNNNNKNLVLSASGSVTATVDNIIISNNLTVNFDTDLQSTAITGTVQHTGNKTQTGDYAIAGEISNSTVKIEDNFITTQSGNTDLDIVASGDRVSLNDSVEIANDLTATGTLTNIDSVLITGALSHTGSRTQTGDYDIAGELYVDNILFEDNFITSTGADQDLELRADGDGIVRMPANNVQIDIDLTVNRTVDLQGTVVTGTIAHTGSTTQTGNYTQTGNITVDGEAVFDRRVDFENVSVDGNIIATDLSNSDLELRASGTGEVKIQNSVIVSNNLSAVGINVIDLTVDSDLVLDELAITDSNVTINDNYITTETSNADLELRATGNVVVNTNDVRLEQNLTVDKDSDFGDIAIAGSFVHQGDRSQTGDYDLTGDLSVSGKFTIADQPFQFENVLVDGNVITTTQSNSDLELHANGTAELLFNDSVNVDRSVSVRDVSVNEIVINNSFSLENLISSTDIEIFDNVITTTNSNSNLELRANGTGKVYLQDLGFSENIQTTLSTSITLAASTLSINAVGSLQLPVGNNITGNSTGDVRFNLNQNLFEGFSQTNQFFGGVYSQNAQTNVRVNNSDQILFNVNNSQVASLTATQLILTGFDVNNVIARNNEITATDNIDLLLTPDGLGTVVLTDFEIDDNKLVNNNTSLVIAHTDNGYAKINATNGFVVPTGDTASRGSDPQQGELRWNTELEIQEVFNGTEWIPSRGTVPNVTISEMGELIDEWSLILG